MNKNTTFFTVKSITQMDHFLIYYGVLHRFVKLESFKLYLL